MTTLVTSPSIDESLLTCVLCNRQLHNPKLLPCLHVFCKKCLRTHAEKTKRQVSLDFAIPSEAAMRHASGQGSGEPGAGDLMDGQDSGYGGSGGNRDSQRKISESQFSSGPPSRKCSTAGLAESNNVQGSVPAPESDYTVEENYYEIPMNYDIPKPTSKTLPSNILSRKMGSEDEPAASKAPHRHSHLTRRAPVSRIKLDRTHTVYENEDEDIDTYVTVGSITPDIKRKMMLARIPVPSPKIPSTPVPKQLSSSSLDVEVPALENKSAMPSEQYVTPDARSNDVIYDQPSVYVNEQDMRVIEKTSMSEQVPPPNLKQAEYKSKKKSARFKHWTIGSFDSGSEEETVDATDNNNDPIGGYLPVTSLAPPPPGDQGTYDTPTRLKHKLTPQASSDSVIYDTPKADPTSQENASEVYDVPHTSLNKQKSAGDISQNAPRPPLMLRRTSSLNKKRNPPHKTKRGIENRPAMALPTDSPRTNLPPVPPTPPTSVNARRAPDPPPALPPAPPPSEDSGFVSPTTSKEKAGGVHPVEEGPLYEDMSVIVCTVPPPQTQFPCPECDLMCTLPEGGVDDLQSCTLIKSLQDLIPVSQKAETSKQKACNHCESKPAKVKCLECQKFFCDGCHDAHNWLKTNVNHKVKTISKATTSTRQKRASKSKSKSFDGPPCKSHRRKEAVAVCGVCDVMVCSGCIAGEHAGHRTKPIDETARRHRDHLQYLVSGVKETIDDMATSLEAFDKYRTSCSEKKQGVLNQLEEQKARILAKVEEQFNAMKLAITEDVTEEIRKAKEKEREIGKTKAQLQQGIIFSEHLVRYGQDGDIIPVSAAVKESIERMTRIPKPDLDTKLEMTYTAGALTSEVISQVTGEVHIECTQLPTEKVSPKYVDVMCAIQDDQCEPILNHAFKAKTFKDSCGCKPTGVVLLPNHSLLIVDDINKKVKRFDQKGHLLWECHPDGDRALVDPWDIAVTHEEHIVVTDRNGGKVTVFDHQGEFVREFGKHMLSAWGVAINSHNEILVTDALQQTVFVHNQQGDVLLTLPNKVQYSPNLFLCPEYVAVGRDDDIIVSDFEKHCILVFNDLGQLLFTFGSRGNGPGNLDVPCGVCVDINGDILVSDYNNQRIVKVGRNGKHLGCLATRAHGLVLPQAVAFSTTGHMIVLDRSEIKVFRFKEHQEPDFHVVFDEPGEQTPTPGARKADTSLSRSYPSQDSLGSISSQTIHTNLSYDEPQIYDHPLSLRRGQSLRSPTKFETEV